MVTSEAMAQDVINNNDAGSSNNDHRFFDPRIPAQPGEILGLDTEAVLRLSRAVTALGVLPVRANMALYSLPNAIRIYPLLEKMQTTDEPLRPEDIRLYRKPIKKLSMGVNAVDKLSVIPGAIGIVGLRRSLNRRVEREFPGRANEAISAARENLAIIESSVEFVSSFKNPKAQFEAELNKVADVARQSIIEQRNMRLAGRGDVAERPTPKGVAGFFTKVVRKMRGFFGFFSYRKLETNIDITAYDAAGGIDQTIKYLVGDRESTKHKLPMLSGLLLDKLPLDKLPTRDQLAFLAPEILTSIFSAVPKNKRDDAMLESVRRNPHEFRFITRFKKYYGRYSLLGAQYSARTLLPAILDVLPSDGNKVMEIFIKTKALLKPTAETRDQSLSTNERPDIKLTSTKRRKGLKNTIASLKNRKFRKDKTNKLKLKEHVKI